MRIRAGDPVSGVVVRSLVLSARTRVERFRALFDGKPAEEWDLPGSDEIVVGEFRFEGVAGESLLLWDGSVNAGSAEEAHGFFDGNLDRYETPVERVIDATTARALPDAEFWPIIDSPGGRTWESTTRKAERLTADRGEEFAVRWAQTAGLKALELSDVLNAAGWEAGDQLHVIGATLAQGLDVFSAVRRDPESFDARWLADLSSQTIWIGARALNRLGPHDEWVNVETVFSTRHRALLERADADTRRWQLEHDIPQDIDREPSFRIARAVVDLTGRYRERLFLLVDAEDSPDAPTRHVVESFGGEIVAGPEFSSSGGFGGLFNCEVFTIKRRSSAPATEYLANHTSAPD
ncbi:hypothetical protein [Agromyces sp. LHK192]|uniref:hypothetical protein n=1 Tax=Agromyces sp. LHK192 TaxID=2498704 RepID=UPI000FDBBEB8|nr:hypothetical protein [Agromyces sp. LHK192]